MKTAITAAILAAAAFAAQAGETYDMKGKATGTAETLTYEISKGFMVLGTIGEYTKFEFEDADNPVAGLTGQCFGAVEIFPGGVSGGGNCVYSNDDGDKAVLRWTAARMGEEGELQGTWTLLGGTGTFENSSGGGIFSSRSVSAEGEFVNRLWGSIALQ